MVLDTKKDISSFLQKGENDIRITLKSSLRNLFGPHHNKFYKEQQYVGPDIFTMYKTWKDGVSEMYAHTYSLVPFGVNSIQIIKN